MRQSYRETDAKLGLDVGGLHSRSTCEREARTREANTIRNLPDQSLASL
jgi:hypothetical protein